MKRLMLLILIILLMGLLDLIWAADPILLYI